MSGQVPPTGALYLDHTGHFVPNADNARAELLALGFTVTPFSAQVQPNPVSGEPELTGTGNICVMLPEGYLEILVHTADTSLGREFNAALNRRAGLHLVAFGASDTEERHSALCAAGHAMRPLVHFSRDVATEDGHLTASFTVARLQAGAMPEGRVQICTHHTPEALWQPRWTRHSNGARRLVSLIISSPDPEETADRFARFLGVPAQGLGQGWRISLARGMLEFLPEHEVETMIGHRVAPGESAFAALRIAVSDLSTLAASLGKHATMVSPSGVIVPFGPALGRGAFLFEEC